MGFIMENKLDEIFFSTGSVKEYAEKYTQYLSQLLKNLDISAIEDVTNVFLKARDQGKKIIFIGNGGSAATASHFANDFAIGMKSAYKPFKALSLTDNVAVLTCIGNDFGYENIFVKQLEVLLEPGDVIVAISASGNSPNLVKAVEYASERGNFCMGFVGFDGGRLKELCPLNIHIQSGKGEYGPVEDIHMVLDHLISTYLYRFIRKES